MGQGNKKLKREARRAGAIGTGVSVGVVRSFDPDRVKPLPGQPRKRFGGIKELAASISEVGQTCPGIVTLLVNDPKFDAQLVDGERRLRSCKLAGKRFRAEVRPAGDPEEVFVASFAANFGKQNHDVLEIAEGLARMQKAGKSVEQLARIAGKSQGWVYQHLGLLKLCPDVRAMLVCDPDQEDVKPALSFQLAMLLAPVPEAQRRHRRKTAQGIAGGPADEGTSNGRQPGPEVSGRSDRHGRRRRAG